MLTIADEAERHPQGLGRTAFNRSKALHYIPHRADTNHEFNRTKFRCWRINQDQTPDGARRSTRVTIHYRTRTYLTAWLTLPPFQDPESTKIYNPYCDCHFPLQEVSRSDLLHVHFTSFLLLTYSNREAATSCNNNGGLTTAALVLATVSSASSSQPVSEHCQQ